MLFLKGEAVEGLQRGFGGREERVRRTDRWVYSHISRATREGRLSRGKEVGEAAMNFSLSLCFTVATPLIYPHPKPERGGYERAFDEHALAHGPAGRGIQVYI